LTNAFPHVSGKQNTVSLPISVFVLDAQSNELPYLLPLDPKLEVPEGQPAIEERWKGIGIRIEDDVADTELGHENLTVAALKAAAAMER